MKYAKSAMPSGQYGGTEPVRLPLAARLFHEPSGPSRQPIPFKAWPKIEGIQMSNLTIRVVDLNAKGEIFLLFFFQRKKEETFHSIFVGRR